MESFEYYNPVKVVFGAGVLEKTGEYAAMYGKRAMLVTYTDAAFFKPVIERLHNSLALHGVDCVDYYGVSANPKLSQAYAGVELCRNENIDIMIALGGGSVMDCTKIISAGVKYPYDLSKMIVFSHSNVQSIAPREALPMIMIPTLPATGSEMNPTAVITDDATGKKSYVWEPSCLYAKVAVMDPELILTLPPYQSACGAFDIIAHVTEAYLNAECGTGINYELQDRMQEGVIRAVLDTVPKIRENPSDTQARGVMMWAASIGLNGWLTAGTFGMTPMHQMGHVLSGRYNATHGATLACMMPAWMRFFADRPDNGRYKLFAERVFGCGICDAADKFENTMREYGVQTRISQFGAAREDIPSLADTVKEVSFLPNGKLFGRPQLTRDEIETIYNIAY